MLARRSRTSWLATHMAHDFRILIASTLSPEKTGDVTFLSAIKNPHLPRRTRRWRRAPYSRRNTCSFRNPRRWCPLWSVGFVCAAPEGFPRWCLPWPCRNWSCGHCGTRKRTAVAWGSKSLWNSVKYKNNNSETNLSSQTCNQKCTAAKRVAYLCSSEVL